MEAAKNNWSILMERNFDIKQDMGNTILDSTFEFNDIKYLLMVFDKYPSWNILYSMITEGIIYPLREITENECLIRLEANLKQRNYPTHSPKANQKIVDFTNSEVEYGYLILILKDKVKEIPGAEVCPIYIVIQQTINKQG